MGYLLGIDLGTSSIKTILIDEAGRIVSKASKELSIHTPRSTWAEQQPEEWWKAAKETIHKVINIPAVKKDNIKGIGLSGQMHGTVLIDKDYKLIRPAIIWPDQRSFQECREIDDKLGKNWLYEITGIPTATGFTAPSLCWIRKNEPHNYERIFKIILPKDYLRLKLTGEIASEVTDASGTLLFNIKRRNWSKEILTRLNILQDILPPISESQIITGKVTSRASKETGLKAGIPVAAGGGDQAMGAIGNAIVKTELASSTIATGGQFVACIDEAIIDPGKRLHTFCHAIPNKWLLVGGMLSAGLSLRWFRNNIAEMSGDNAYERLIEEAAKVEIGSGGLIFLPYLIGERTPHMDAKARGVFLGFTICHRRAHMARAIMEGVVYGIRDSLEIFKNLGIKIDKIAASGGGAKSKLWRQIQADIFNTELARPNIDEHSVYGAALLSGVTVGIYKNIEEACQRGVNYVNQEKPIEVNVKKYNEYYKIYQALYPKLKETFAMISKVSES